MPLVGTICCRDGAKHSFDHCLSECRRGNCVFSLPKLESMASKIEKRKNAGISATDLLGCPVQFCLSRSNDYYESPAEYHARWRGEFIHKAAEAGGPWPGVVQEQRIHTTVDGLDITGMPDWIEPDRGYLEDWKSTVMVPSRPYDDHIAQVNIYAWLVERELGWTVQNAAIRYIDMKREVVMPVELWTHAATDAFVRRRIEPIKRYLIDGDLPTVGLPGKDAWKSSYCVWRGTGRCCADIREANDPPRPKKEAPPRSEVELHPGWFD